jgi:hypothetical protein
MRFLNGEQLSLSGEGQLFLLDILEQKQLNFIHDLGLTEILNAAVIYFLEPLIVLDQHLQEQLGLVDGDG